MSNILNIFDIIKIRAAIAKNPKTTLKKYKK